REFLLSLTVGCIAATLFVKATTIQKLMHKLKLDELTEIEKIEAQEARALIHHEVRERIRKYERRGYIDPEVAEKLYTQHQEEYELACQALTSENKKELALRVLR